MPNFVILVKCNVFFWKFAMNDVKFVIFVNRGY